MRLSWTTGPARRNAMRGRSRNVDSQLHRQLHVPMSDRYQGFVQSPLGRLLVKNVGLPDPVRLDRYTAGEPLVDGLVGLGGRGRLAESLPGILDGLGIASTDASAGPGETAFKGLVLDATGLTSASELVALRDFF